MDKGARGVDGGAADEGKLAGGDGVAEGSGQRGSVEAVAGRTRDEEARRKGTADGPVDGGGERGGAGGSGDVVVDG